MTANFDCGLFKNKKGKMAADSLNESQLLKLETNEVLTNKCKMVGKEAEGPESTLLNGKSEEKQRDPKEGVKRKMPGLEKIKKSSGKFNPQPKKLTKGKIFLITSGLFLIFCSIISFVYTPVDVMLRERLRMLPGFPPFDWWKDPPDEVLLKVYIFNVTNSQEYFKGTDSKLRLQEIGPYVFQEKLRHTNVTFNGNGTMTYTAHRSAIFLPELSPNVSLNARLIVPNLALLGGASFLSEYSFLTKLGFNMLIRRLNSLPFVEISANDYMWNWTDPLVGIAKKVMPNLVPVENMGILETIYKNFVDQVTVYIGPGNDRRFFLIDKFHGTPRMGFWPDERCDSAVNSTEGVTYPQFITRNDTIRYLRKTICRVAKLYWANDLVQESMTAYRFELPENTFHRPENKEDDCFTLPGDKPLPSGIADISPCYYKFPIGISLPHFYGGTEDLRKRLNLEGLQADKKKHGSYVIVEPTTGVPMESRARSQCNLIVKNLAGFNGDLHRFSNTIIPMFWLEYGQQGLPWYVSFLMYMIVVVLPATQHWFSLFIFVIGTAFLYYGFSSHFLYIYRRFVYRLPKWLPTLTDLPPDSLTCWNSAPGVSRKFQQVSEAGTQGRMFENNKIRSKSHFRRVEI